MAKVEEKITRCRYELLKWSKSHFGNITRKLKEKKKALNEAEQASMQGHRHDQVIALRH